MKGIQGRKSPVKMIFMVAWPGIEPGFAGSQPDVITTILPRERVSPGGR